jgi:hypothetical protein
VAEGEITAAVRAFIHQHINSVEQLEVLLLMLNRRDKEWSATEVSRELYIQAASAATRLADLQRSRLLQSTPGNPPTYRYAPAEPTLDRTVREVASAYSIRRVGVINIILEKPLDNVRVFSDAFRIRRDN